MPQKPLTIGARTGVAVVAAALFTAGCTATSQQAVTISGPQDKLMSCAQIELEQKANEAQALAVVQGHFDSRRASLAIEVDEKYQIRPAYVALDVDEAQVAHLRSLRQRNTRLASLADKNLCTIDHSRWIGQGSRDACGYQWAADVRIENGRMTGSLWRETVEYGVHGPIGKSGKVKNVTVFRRRSAFGLPGPRYLTLDLAFTPNSAQGEYRVEDGGRAACDTKIMLKRHSGNVNLTEADRK